MSKQMIITLLAIFLFIMENHGRTLRWDDNDGYLKTVRSRANSKMIARRINLMHPNNREYLDQWLSYRERSSIDDQSQFQQDMLEAHNKYRALHCTPALQLSDEMNSAAVDYAKKLAEINEMVHSTGTNQGENLAQEWSSEPLTNVDGASVTKQWYDEIKLYDYNNPGFSMETGHFTQVVWKETTLLGAGFAITGDGKTVYSVARYSPAGNMEGAYQDNVLQPTC